MRNHHAVASLAVLCCVLAAAVQVESADPDAGDDYCRTCVDGSEPRYRPIRGDGEVKFCEDGYYCDCGGTVGQDSGKKKHCMMPLGKFNPESPDSPCNPTFNCQAWFDKQYGSTAAPTPASTAAPTPASTAAPRPGTTAAPGPGTTAAPKPGTTAAPKTSAAPSGSTATPDKPKPNGASWGRQSTAALLVLGVALAAL